MPCSARLAQDDVWAGYRHVFTAGQAGGLLWINRYQLKYIHSSVLGHGGEPFHSMLISMR